MDSIIEWYHLDPLSLKYKRYYITKWYDRERGSKSYRKSIKQKPNSNAIKPLLSGFIECKRRHEMLKMWCKKN